MALKPGDPAPDFTLPSTVGEKLTLSDLRGKKNVLLMFYPLDFSPVCSVENKQCTEMLPSKGSTDVAGARHLRRLALGPQGVRRAERDHIPPARGLPSEGRRRAQVRRLPGGQGHLRRERPSSSGRTGRSRRSIASDIPVARDIAGLIEKARAA